MSGSDSAGVNAMVPGRKCEPDSSVFTWFGAISLAIGVSTFAEVYSRHSSCARFQHRHGGRNSYRAFRCGSFRLEQGLRATHYVDSWSCL